MNTFPLILFFPKDYYYILRLILVNTAPPPGRSWVMIRHADPDRPIGISFSLLNNILTF